MIRDARSMTLMPGLWHRKAAFDCWSAAGTHAVFVRINRAVPSWARKPFFDEHRRSGISSWDGRHRPLTLAPEGQWSVATGGASRGRSPRDAEPVETGARDRFAPAGAKECSAERFHSRMQTPPPLRGGVMTQVTSSTGSDSLHPWLQPIAPQGRRGPLTGFTSFESWALSFAQRVGVAVSPYSDSFSLHPRAHCFSPVKQRKVAVAVAESTDTASNHSFVIAATSTPTPSKSITEDSPCSVET